MTESLNPQGGGLMPKEVESQKHVPSVVLCGDFVRSVL